MEMWVIDDCGRILWQFGSFHTEEEAQDKIDSLSYFGDLLEPVQIVIQRTEINNRLKP